MTIVVGIDTEHQSDEGMAEQILADLCQTYPGHAWFVSIKGGILHIKNLDWNEKWGMALHYSQIKADAQDRKRQVIRAAGEFLERANVRRGMKEDTTVKRIDGVPDKHMGRIGL